MAVETLAELKPWQAPKLLNDWTSAAPREYEWSGYLTLENEQHVARRIREQFEGRALVITTAHEYRRWQPEVEAPVRIERGVQLGGDHDYAHVMFAAGGFVYGLHSNMLTQPRFRWDVPTGGGTPAEVLEWIDEAYERHWTPHLEFDQYHLIVRERAPNGLGYWVRIDSLENAKRLNVVLDAEQAALAHAGIGVALDVDRLGGEGYDVRRHIEAVFGGEDKVGKWLPRS